MTQYSEMTKKELLAVAKDLEIQGRHDMTKEELLEAILEEDPQDDEDGEEDAVEVADKETLVEMKRRRPSNAERDENGRVIRKDRNLSGNLPFEPKLYALSSSVANERRWTEEYKAALAAAPGQVKLILKAMRHEGIVGEDGLRGGEIVELAIAKGYISTKIDPPALWAYYRRLLEALGVVHINDGEG